jgi:hypothetical protein
MPSRDRTPQTTARSQDAKPSGYNVKIRKLTFETQSWYAEAARRFSAAPKQDELRHVPLKR